MTDTMQMQAAVSIDRKIGGTNAQMPAVEQTPEETVKPPVSSMRTRRSSGGATPMPTRRAG